MRSPDAERAAVGAALYRAGPAGAALAAMEEGLEVGDFVDRRLGLAWSAISALAREGASIDCGSVAVRMAAMGDAGSESARLGFLIELSEGVASSPEAAAKQHARTLRGLSRVRALARVAEEIAREARAPGPDADAWLAGAAARVLAVAEERRPDEIYDGEALAERAWRRLEDARDDRIPTGFRGLDHFGFLFRGSMTVVGARPGAGKTALALNIALHAESRGHRVLFVSREMTEDQIVGRVLTNEPGADLRRREDPRIQEGLSRLSKRDNLLGWFPSDVSALDILARARRLHLLRPLDLIVVDYLQLVEAVGPGRRETREQEVRSISATLTQIAKGLGCAVLAVAQLNRGAEEGEPRLGHLRESGAIEADAAVVALLHRPDAERDERDLIIAKHRFGPVSDLALRFDGQRQRFEEV